MELVGVVTAYASKEIIHLPQRDNVTCNYLNAIKLCGCKPEDYANYLISF